MPFRGQRNQGPHPTASKLTTRFDAGRGHEAEAEELGDQGRAAGEQGGEEEAYVVVNRVVGTSADQ